MLINRAAARLGVVGVLALAGVASAEPTVMVASPGVHQAITQNMSLSAYTLQKTEVEGRLGQPLEIQLNIDGEIQTFNLRPFSLRSENFQAFIQVESGELVEIEAPAPRTYRGTNADGSMILSGSLLDTGFKGQILGETTGWGVQPLDDVARGADTGLYVVYDIGDSLPTGHTCAGAPAGHDHAHEPVAQGDSGQRGSGLLACEIIIDADWHYYNNFNGANEAVTIADVENVMSGVDTVYVRDVDVTFVLNQIVVRTSQASNPYTTNVSENLLDQVRSEWVGSGADRDLVHLFTGRNLSGSTIGIAWLGAVCSNNLGYGLSQTRFTTNYNNRVALTAHEVGHNFNAPHCSGGSCYIMCAGLGGCGGVSPPGVSGAGFGNSSINTISNYASNRPCLDPAGPPFLDWPFSDDFASTTLDPDVWQVINGAVVNSGGVGEPSAPNSLNLDNADNIETGRFNLADDVGEPLLVSFWAQNRGAEAGENLIIEYFNISSNWQNLATVASDGSVEGEYTFYQFPVPLLAFHAETKFRLRASGNEGNDDWYVDDFSIAPYAGLNPPFSDDFESGLDTSFTYETVSGAITSSGADNEPSGTSSLNLDNADSIATYNINMSSVFGMDWYVRFYTQHKGTEPGESLIVEYRDLADTWQPLATIPSDGVNQTEFDLQQVLVPLLGFQDNFAIRFRATGNESNDDWYIDDLALTTEFIEPGDGCNDADIAEPFDVLDFSDVVAFLSAFATCEPEADLASPFGTCDFSDVVAFLALFGGGCP